MPSDSRKTVFIAGHKGMVGSALLRALKMQDVIIKTADRKELDLLDQRSVFEYFADVQVDEVYLAAARVGGIHANNAYPASFIYENLVIQNNVIEAAHRSNVDRLLFLGSSCIYPKYAEQPMREDSLLTGQLEPTNEPYAIAKIAGIKLCESYNRQYGRHYRSVMPTNLYGINDNFHLENAHVLPALMRRIHEAKQNNLPKVTVWGTGNARREFLNVDDMAHASIFVMNLDDEVYEAKTSPMMSHLNVGTGQDCTIRELATTLVQVIGYEGELEFDTTKPDGTPRKLMDVSILKSMGWTPSIDLEYGIRQTYDWFINNIETTRT